MLLEGNQGLGSILQATSASLQAQGFAASAETVKDWMQHVQEHSQEAQKVYR
jgi:hypothetical protein